MVYNEQSTVFYDLFFLCIKMSYYQLNKDKLLREAKYRYYNGGDNERFAQYYRNNQEVLK